MTAPLYPVASAGAGETTGPNPTDRCKAGSKHHRITDARGVPLVAQVSAANVNDITPLPLGYVPICWNYLKARKKVFCNALLA